MQALEAAGDRAGALRHASVHSELLRADLDAAPEREVLALADRLRLESRAASGGSPAPAPPNSPPPFRSGANAVPMSAVPTPGQPTRRGWVAPEVGPGVVWWGVGVLGGTLSRARSPELTPGRVAAVPFENRTGRPDLDDLGPMAADWMIRGVMETPLVDVSDLEAMYARGKDNSGRRIDPLALARDSAAMVVRGSYYLSGDSVLFQASIMDVASGRMLRSFAPVGAPVRGPPPPSRCCGSGSRRSHPAGQSGDLGGPVDPDLVPPPSLPAYREFVAGIRPGFGDWEAGRSTIAGQSAWIRPSSRR